ncbi:cryptochrome/photolyase family protein [Lysinibacter cavernae]|uniref:cryptochrome/photolyase family protein n=1 Tax=Lysinibacter cavernae TaxID=1640652 RepID=UPI00141D9AC3|nr:deoxyribodipyrimidine photo-lyase [Lysinibacter cavernae]
MAEGTADGPVALVWLRNDLRLADNPALQAGIAAAGPRGTTIVVYVLETAAGDSQVGPEAGPDSAAPRALGAASRWWLHHSLSALADDLGAIGGKLVLRAGDAATVIPGLAAEIGADAVFWNRRYTNARNADITIKAALTEAGCEARSFHANLLHEPWTVQTGQGTPFRVFTPYWRACLATPEPREPLPAPTGIRSAPVHSDTLTDWGLLPTAPDWASGLRATWTPGERGAHERLDAFLNDGIDDYHLRDEPADGTTSWLSPHLRFGEISPFAVWDAVRRARSAGVTGQAANNAAKFLSEVGWREFNTSILFSFPALREQNVRPEFAAFPWATPDQDELAAWRDGRTGIPLVDAGMRELWHTGTMHNRVRMVVASFLIKNLLVDWRIGEAWFWDTLVDADEASNPGNWQWVAGSGVDAAPYFRVFNPELQAKKFDPHGEYVRRWVPEYGTPSYPAPIVDLRETRGNALAAYSAMRAALPDPAASADRADPAAGTAAARPRPPEAT